MTMERDESRDKLDEKLKEAWRQKTPPSPPEDWEEGVMRDVRALAREEGAPNHVIHLHRIVWRGTAAASIIALIFVGLALGTGMELDIDLVRLVMEDPEGLLELLLFY